MKISKEIPDSLWKWTVVVVFTSSEPVVFASHMSFHLKDN